LKTEEGIVQIRLCLENKHGRKWRESEKIQTLIFPHGGGIPTIEHAKLLLEVDKILIGGAYYNTAAQGMTMSLSKIWDDNVLYAYIAPTPSQEVPSFMYGFAGQFLVFQI